VLEASAGETHREGSWSRDARERLGLVAFRAAASQATVLLSATTGIGTAIPARGEPRPLRRGLVLALLAAVVAAIALPSHGSLSTRAGAPLARHRALTELTAGARSGHLASLLSLPAAARASISAALGRDQAAYRVRGVSVQNPAQRLAARFGRSGVVITTGSARFEVALRGFGRGSALRTLSAVVPVVHAERVSYAHGPVREWWMNGPLGLEQGFDIARRPAGSGALTLSLAMTGSIRLAHGFVLLPGGLRYAGVHATDARGRALRASLAIHDGRVLVRVDDRGARYPLHIDPFVQRAELRPTDGAGCDDVGCDEFGYSVAASGSTVVVGAPYHAANSQAYSGAVYVFQKPAAGWAGATQTAELSDSALGGKVELGFSVAISSDGHTIVAGAPAGSETPRDVNGTNTQGTVDVFTSSGSWASTSTPNARLTVAGAPATESPLGGELGWSVAIDGSTIVAGAPYDASAYPYTGLAYVFDEPGGGWSGAQTQSAVLTGSPLSTSNSGEDLFGWSVGISGDTIVVGAPDWAGAGAHIQGAAYVFTGPWSGTQTQTAQLLASDPTATDQLGLSVAISGNTVVAGSYYHNLGQGSVYVFVMPATGPWVSTTQTAELTAKDRGASDYLGYSVAISGDTIVAGAPARQIGSYDSAGAVYGWTEPSGGWANTSADTAELTAGDGTTNDGLGGSIAVSGSTIVAGAPRHVASSATADFGAAYVFGSAAAAAPTVKLRSISGGHAKITATLSCPTGGATCAKASLKATVKEHLKGRKITAITASSKKRASTKTKKVVVASGGAALSAGKHKTLTLTLNATGRALLLKFGKLRAIVTVSSEGKTIKTVTVSVLKPEKKR
jgi:hypothetical protein